MGAGVHRRTLRRRAPSRLHAVGLEMLLQRTSEGAPDDWVEGVATGSGASCLTETRVPRPAPGRGIDA